MKLTRRVFIELAGSSALMASAPSLLAQGITVKRLPLPCSPAQGRWIGSACQGCTQYCAIEVFNQNGRATRVRGNQHSQGNHGFCCPRGHLIPQENYDPDRIKQPLKRTNPQKGRGVDPKWIPITWDEALDIVADKMMELRNAGEPEKLLYLKGRYGNTSHAFYTELSQNCSALRTIFRLPLFVPKLKKWGRAIHKDFSLIETTTWEIQSVLFSGALILLLPTDRFRMSFLDSERFKRTAL